MDSNCSQCGIEFTKSFKDNSANRKPEDLRYRGYCTSCVCINILDKGWTDF